MTTTPETMIVGLEFATLLGAELTLNQWREMRLKNATTHKGDDCCASHDYCDANMTLDEAFTRAMGREADLFSIADTAILNAAHGYAKDTFLTASAAEVANG